MIRNTYVSETIKLFFLLIFARKNNFSVSLLSSRRVYVGFMKMSGRPLILGRRVWGVSGTKGGVYVVFMAGRTTAVAFGLKPDVGNASVSFV